MRTATSILLIALFAGCAARSTTPGQFTVQEARIVDVARRAVATNGWGQATFKRPERWPEGGWSVLGEAVPAVSGGYWVFIIDDNEKLTRIIPGL